MLTQAGAVIWSAAPAVIGWRKEIVMHCETLSESGQQISPRRDVEFTISFDDIRIDDKVLISTMNSEYRFSVIDPTSHKGLLSGGSIGDEPQEAFLIESLSRGDDGNWHDFRGLKTGARALFYIGSGRHLERVTTSKISRLTLVKAADRTSLIS